MSLALTSNPDLSCNLPTAVRHAAVKDFQEQLSGVWNAHQEIAFQTARAQPKSSSLVPESRTAFLQQFSIEVQSQIAKIYQLPESQAAREWHESLDGDLELYDLTVRHVNDRLTEWLLQSPDIHAIPLAEVLSLIQSIQTHNAITQYPGETPTNTLQPENIFRQEGEDVWQGGSEMHLPYVHGEFVADALENLLATLEEEFKNLPPEQATAKAKKCFNLAILIHPQKDFNKRTFRHFFTHLVDRATSHTASIAHTDFIPSFETVREDLYIHYFPELAQDRALRYTFIKTFHPKTFNHNGNPAHDFEMMIAASNLGGYSYLPPPEDKWEFRPAEGVVMGDVEYFLLLHNRPSSSSTRFERDDLFARLKKLESLELESEYHQVLSKIAQH